MADFRIRGSYDMAQAIQGKIEIPRSPNSKVVRPVVETGGGDEMRYTNTEEEDKKFSSNLHSIFQMMMNKKTNIYSTAPVPLSTPWTFWVDRTQRGVGVEQFEANLKRIYTVYTLHRFWGVFYNIPKPSALHYRSSLHMMRDERKPIWEEQYNCIGGTFRFRCQKRDTDKVWRELLLAAIGEQLNEYVSPNDEVCGISVTVRDREDTVSVWNTNADEVDRARIFECVHKLLPDTVFVSEFYKPHSAHHAFEKPKAGGSGSVSASSSSTATNISSL